MSHSGQSPVVRGGSNSTQHLENDFHDISNRKLVSTLVSKHSANSMKQPVPCGCVFSNKKKREIMGDVVGDSIEQADEGKTEKKSSMD